ncbi:MAG: phosphate ABC transporter permease PstA [Clostridiales bacterium]|nr:phosphate ABC transporter permease PstA [Clostridiales bacterium]
MKTLTAKLRKSGSPIMRGLIYLAAALTVGVMLFITAYILVKGIPNLTPELFAWEYNSSNVSMLPAIINTVIVTFCTLLIAVPIGICSAVFLAEYAKRGSRLVSLIRVTNETLAGIPSIVYGLFGYLAFVITPGRSYSLLAGALTLTIMVLPTIVRTTEESLIAVPDSYREGSFGLGAGKLRTVFRIIIPTAMPGILSGVILSIGRIVGETAALIFTAGTLAEVPKGIFSSVRTLAVHMYCLMNEGLYTEQAYATAVVLLVLAAIINWVSNFAAKKLSKR